MKNHSKIIKAAAGVALTAGVVAAGAALTDDKMRSKAVGTAKKGMAALRDAASDLMEDNETGNSRVAHQISRIKAGKRTRSTRKR